MSTIQLTTARAARRDGASRRARRGSSWAHIVQRAVDLVLTWRRRDIGLTRADVFAEASKPFWRS
jgi:hypothetical protein